MPLGNLTTKSPAYPHAADEGGVVRLNVPCRMCGYILRALHEQARCPECGVPVELSLDPSLLRFAHVGWVRTLWMGATLNLAGICGPLGMLLLAGLARIGMPMSGATRVIGPMLLLTSLALIFAGSWLLTTEEPRASGRWEIANTQRRTARNAILTSGIAAVWMVVLLWIGRGSGFFILLAAIAFLVAGIAGLVWHSRILSPLASAIRRVPDLTLADGAERMHIYLVVSGTLLIATFLFGTLGTGLAVLFVALFLMSVVIAWIAWLIFSIQIMTRFKREYLAALRTQEPE